MNESQRKCNSDIPHFDADKDEPLTHNFSSTNWQYTCYLTFAKTNRNEHTKKERTKNVKNKKACVAHVLSFEETSISPDTAVGSEIHNLRAVKTRVTLHEKHPLRMQIMLI